MSGKIGVSVVTEFADMDPKDRYVVEGVGESLRLLIIISFIYCNRRLLCAARWIVALFIDVLWRERVIPIIVRGRETFLFGYRF